MLSLCGCYKAVEKDGVSYNCKNGRYNVSHIIDSNKDDFPKNVYVFDEINGIPVQHIEQMWGNTLTIWQGKKMERIYFPWSLEYSEHSVRYGRNYPEAEGKNLYLISASTKVIIEDRPHLEFLILVVPSPTYDKIMNNEFVGRDNLTYGYVDEEYRFRYNPANIAYFFNYEDTPNEGYFFVDLLEETGKLTKPPYDPKREGYEFSGWYTDAECTDKWDFDNDVVTIEFDEEGNRIYEEFCLYAKWEVEEKTQWEKLLDLFK